MNERKRSLVTETNLESPHFNDCGIIIYINTVFIFDVLNITERN